MWHSILEGREGGSAFNWKRGGAVRKKEVYYIFLSIHIYIYVYERERERAERDERDR